MFPMPLTRFWSSSWRLIATDRLRMRRTTESGSKSGSSGSRPMCAISSGSSAPPSETASPPNIRWSTNLSSEPSSRAKRTRRCRSSAAPAGWTSIWPLIPRWPSSASPESSGSQKYLPRRLGLSKRRPVSAAAKPDGPRGSRRTGRSCSTSTAVTVRPVTWRSSPARTTSTSGSSGTSGRLEAGDRRVLDAEASRDLAVRRLRGGLLGLLLGAADAVAVQLLTDADLRGEGLHVVGALVLDDVLGDAEAVLGGELLERGLPVQAGAHGRGGL